MSITSKMHAVYEEVMRMASSRPSRAETDLDGLVIWQPAPFAVGANPAAGGRGLPCQTVQSLEKGWWAKVPAHLDDQARAGSPSWPRCRAWRWVGAGEFVMHAAHRVFAPRELRRPGGGGRGPDRRRRQQGSSPCRRMRWRSARPGRRLPLYIQNAFLTIAMATVAKSARRRSRSASAVRVTTWCSTPTRSSMPAIHRARCRVGLAAGAGQPAVTVAGQRHRHREMMLVEHGRGGFISAHDYRVAGPQPPRRAVARSTPTAA